MERTELKAAGSKEQAGAVVHEQETDLDQLDWETIDWSAIERGVDRLHTRIVKAKQEGRWNKVKKLQYLLTHSRAAKLLAVRRVTENQGSKTPGVDGQT
jgi:RNA-directed DNA polymerase